MENRRSRTTYRTNFMRDPWALNLKPAGLPAAPTRREPSFTERYRGTEFETPVQVARPDAPIARGRAFVLVSGATLILTTLAVFASVSG